LSVNLARLSIHSISVKLRTFSSVFSLGSVKPTLHFRLSFPRERPDLLSLQEPGEVGSTRLRMRGFVLQTRPR